MSNIILKYEVLKTKVQLPDSGFNVLEKVFYKNQLVTTS